MSFDNSMKFGSPVYYLQLEKAYEIGKSGHTNPGFMLELKELIEYAQYVPYRNYRYEVATILSKYYSNSYAMLDPTAVKMHNALFGPQDDDEKAKHMSPERMAKDAEKMQTIRMLKMSVKPS